ncbi:transglutaminase domain-containing protein [Metabacillus sp. KIGAM252]|uniref:Transglutaminase domain-containing protein n=1 Tax=Metabacillus flavus TaxID=2823519 RepID=A0ABS5L9W9_9BACI|nr:transglutaminase domain-containing protein [Metabacillus flavus]MBS2967524.1 transglutaminase domain-containing protein [Metabacillus flavus]
MKVLTLPKGDFFSKITALLYYLFAFFLLWEWLVPLDIYTDTGSTWIFVLFIALNFLLSYLRVTWMITIPLQLGFLAIALEQLFYKEMPLFEGFRSFAREFVYNAGLIPASSWMEMTSPFRTFLFFVLLWLLVYLLNYWIIVQKRILFFFVTTLIYVTILDTFTEYDASSAVIRIVIAGFFLLGMLNFDRLKGMEQLTVKKYTRLKWTMLLLIFVAVSIVSGMASPKAAPQWQDPVPFLTAYGSLDEAINGSGMKKIGYGTNDESLGGAFMQDDTPVLTAAANRRHYWRVETKDVYSGKGWTTSQREKELQSMEKDSIGLTWSEEGTKRESLTARVDIARQYKYSHVIYPLGLIEYVSDEAKGLLVNVNTEQITPFGVPEGERIDSYEVKYNYPSYDIPLLKEVKSTENVPQDIMNRYTQLPEMPQRVLDLARELTANEENLYDKAKAIERHLNGSDFSYNTQEVGVPSEDQDYVDQFLFETMQGYCDNFSTSMTVLLRASGIPARWVKGYTEGDYKGMDTEGSGRIYEVTNNNAHSWVEVYFPGAGWVPFEPTKGFTNPYSFTENTESSTQQQPVPETQQKQPKPEKPEDAQALEQPKQSKQTFDWSKFSIGSTGFYAVIGGVLLLAAVLYLTRKKWLTFIMLARFKNRSDDEVFFSAYPALLKQLERFGLKRQDGETLREFAKSVDYSLSSHDMLHITKGYEKALYKRDDAKAEWDKIAELWENLIKRTSS